MEAKEFLKTKRFNNIHIIPGYTLVDLMTEYGDQLLNDFARWVDNEYADYIIGGHDFISDMTKDYIMSHEDN